MKCITFLHNQSQIIEAIKTQRCRGNIYFIMLLKNIDSNKNPPGLKMKMKHSTHLSVPTVVGAGSFYGI